MRLCYLANPHSIHTQRWVRYFVEQKHDVHLIGLPKLWENTDASKLDLPQDLVVHTLKPAINVRKLWYLPLAYQVKQLVHNIQPDILHAHQLSPPGWLGAASGYHPFMVTVWGSDLLIKPTRSWVFRALARWVLRKADYVTCVSEQLVEEARELGADPTKLEMAPWGIDRTVFHPAEREATLREALNLGPGPVVLSLRPIKPIYNPMDVAYAIPKVLEQVPDAQFIVRTYACHRDLLEQFRSIIARYDATQAVRYVGDLPDEQAISNLYRAADVAVSVPSSDGTPLSVLEALACGTVPVLSDLPSLRAWVRHEVEGLFVPLGDVQAISDSIVRLLIDEELRQRMSQRGSTLIRKRADRQVWMAHAEDLYKQLLYH